MSSVRLIVKSSAKNTSGKGKVPLKVKLEHIPQKGSPAGRSDEERQHSMKKAN